MRRTLGGGHFDVNSEINVFGGLFSVIFFQLAFLSRIFCKFRASNRIIRATDLPLGQRVLVSAVKGRWLATHQSLVSLRRLIDILKRIVRRTTTDRLNILAAGIAFYALLAVFPCVAALIALAGLVTDAEQVVEVLKGLSDILPKDAAAVVLDQVTRVASASFSGLSLTLIVGVLFSLYLATRATIGLMHGLNVVGQFSETRGFFRYWSTVILLTTAVLVGAVFMLLLLIVVPVLFAYIPDGPLSLHLIESVRWFLTALVLLGALELFYRFGPCHDKQRRWRWGSPGVYAALLLWVAGSFGFSIYVANFARYNEIFGSLGGVIILLTWIWLSAFALLLGALLDRELDRY